MDGDTLLQKQITQANTAYSQKDYIKTHKILMQILEKYPDNIAANTQIASIYSLQNKYAEAITHLEKLIRLEPDNYQHYSNIGLMYVNFYEYDKSFAAFKKALELRPDSVNTLLNLGFAEFQISEFEQSEQHYREIFKHNPNWPRAHYNLALLLTLGRYEEGWKEFEERLASSEWQYLKRNFTIPRWQGEDLTNKRLLVYTEQGFGDMLQFARFLSLIKKDNNEIILETKPEIISLFANMPAVDSVTLFKEPLPVFDYHIPLLSIPYTMCYYDELAEEIPYIISDPIKKAYWQNKLAPIKKKTVGLCWTGNPNNLLNPHRSFSIAELLPHLPTDKIQFINLYKNTNTEEKQLLQQHHILDFFDEIHDFADTTALIDNLDLNLTVDTSIAHLCGAMNKPTWVMLSRLPEWRYLLEENKTAWYPSMILFRQKKIGQWDNVFKKISKELEKWLQLP